MARILLTHLYGPTATDASTNAEASIQFVPNPEGDKSQVRHDSKEVHIAAPLNHQMELKGALLSTTPSSVSMG